MIDILFKSLSYIGEREVKGGSSNPLILSWIKRYIPYVKDDNEYAWCSIYMNNIAKDLGYEHTDSALARSWLTVGEEIKEPMIGDVVVLWRTSKESQQGHVGLYIKEDEKNIWILGGNQGDQVSIAPYPKDKLLGYRRLSKMKT